MLHGVAHADAVGVFLVEPCGIKVTGQRARTQERGFVALAFFFGKAHHFDVKGQALVLAVQLAHTGHGDKNAQSAVIFAAIAHGVVVAACEQRLGLGLGGAVTAHHIADGINFDVIKPTVAHPV